LNVWLQKWFGGLYINIFSLESIGGMWLCEKKYKVQNTVFAAAMWVLWNTRNDIYFNRSPWIGLQTVWRKMAYLLSLANLIRRRRKRGLSSVVGGLDHLA
jgi:hypothetical protein